MQITIKLAACNTGGLEKEVLQWSLSLLQADYRYFVKLWSWLCSLAFMNHHVILLYSEIKILSYYLLVLKVSYYDGQIILTPFIVVLQRCWHEFEPPNFLKKYMHCENTTQNFLGFHFAFLRVPVWQCAQWTMLWMLDLCVAERVNRQPSL